MPDVAASLAALAEHPPRPAAPVAEIRARARAHRRQRRWRGAGLAAVAVVATALAADAVRVLVAPDDGSPAAAPAIDASHGPDSVPVRTAIVGVQADRATGLAAHDEVRLTLDDDPGGELLVSQCAASFADLAPRRRVLALGLCGPITTVGPRDAGAAVTFAVQRRLVMGKATFDCGIADGACVVALRASGTESDLFFPLGFAPGPLVEPTVGVTGEAPPYADGVSVTVSGTGFAPGERLVVRQCRQVVPPRSPGEPPECDAAVRSRVAYVGDDGGFTTPFVVSGVVATANESDAPLVDWRLCGFCLLRVEGERSGTVATPLPMATAGSPTGPTIRLADPGPYAPGASVRVMGTGFQPVSPGGEPAGGVVLAWCVTDAPGAECVVLPGAAQPVGPDGGFVAEGVPLPGAGEEIYGTRCSDAPGACSLAWSDGEEVVVLGQMVPLDLSG
jgi:hypothetical protein